MLQGGAIVDAGAQHDLAVELDAPLRQPVQVAQGVPREPVVHHLAPQLGVHGVHRHIDGADAHLQDAVHFPVVNVRERNVVAEQEREPVVIILKVEGFPHPLGQLVDKAEDTLVPAGALLVHQIGGKLQAQRGVLGLDQLQLIGLSPSCQAQAQLPLRLEKPVIQHVHNVVAIDAHKHIPRLDARPRGPAARLHAVDPHRHVPCLLFRPLLRR